MDSSDDKFIFRDGLAIKTINWRADLNDEWLAKYNRLREIEPRLVPVIAVENSNTVIMPELDLSRYKIICEYIERDGKYPDRAFANYLRLFANIVAFNEQENFWHFDFSNQNIIVDPQGDVMLIDPDGFVTLEHNQLFETRYKLARAFQDIEYTYFQRKKRA